MAEGSGAGKRRNLVLLIIILVILAGGYAAGVVFYVKSQNAVAVTVLKNEEVPADHLTAVISTISIDPTKGTIGLRVEVRPHGALARPDRISATRPFTVNIDEGVGNNSYRVTSQRFAPGTPITTVDGTINVDSGDINSYPFDSYTAQTEVSVEASGSPGPSGSAAVPTTLLFAGQLNGYSVDANPLPGSGAANALPLGLTVHRATVSALFAVLLLVFQVLLAAAATAFAIRVWYGRRRVEMPMMTWLAALLFAIVPVRNAMPGAPPIGAEVDVLVFFWAIALIALSLVTVLVTWLRQPGPSR